MKKYFLILVLALMSVGLLGAPAVHATEVVERILAVVNDEIITDQDLQLVMAPIVAQYRTMYTGEELNTRVGHARGEFLNKLIEDRLVLSAAKKKQVIVNDIEIDEMITEVRNKFPSKEQFLKALDDQGMSEKKLWNRFRDQLMTQKYTNYEVRSKVSVSPGEISDYYKVHQDEFRQGERVKLQQILIREGARSDEETQIHLQKILSEIKSDKAFDEVARAYSEGTEAKDGGDMGWIEKGQLLGEIDDKVFALSEGGVTEPIKSALGYHLFKVIKKDHPSLRDISDVRDEIQDMIFREKFKKKLDVWMASLKKTAYISIR